MDRLAKKYGEDNLWHSASKMITLVGTSTESWKKTAKTLQDLHIGQIRELDMQISHGEIIAYRAKVRVSSKYHGEQGDYSTFEDLLKVSIE